MQDILIVMAKEPRPSFVKTRLSPDLTALQAAALYEAILKDVLEQSDRELPSYFLSVAFLPLTARPYFLSILPDRFDCIPQRGPDLPKRLANVFQDASNLGFSKIVVRNSDSPQMPANCVEAAFQALDRVDIVLAPDGSGGGYSLVGQKRPHPRLFSDVTMSTSSVLEETLAIAREDDLSVELLDPILDLDTIDDVEALIKTFSNAATGYAERMPRTLAELKELGLMETKPS